MVVQLSNFLDDVILTFSGGNVAIAMNIVVAGSVVEQVSIF